MKLDLPRASQWKQANDGDFLGTIWSSRNIDLLKSKGKVRPSEKVIVTTQDDDSANYPQTTPYGFAFAYNDWHCIAGAYVYESGAPNGAFTQETSIVGMDSATADIKEFNGDLYVAESYYIWAIDSGGTKTSVTNTLENKPHIMETYNGRLYYVDDYRTIGSMDSDEVLGTTTYTLDLEVDADVPLRFSCMRKASNGLWLGTINDGGGRAHVYFWDGTTQNTVEIDIEVDFGMCMAMTIKGDIPYILDNRGILHAFNGSYFEEVSRIDTEDIQLYNFDAGTSLDRWIHHNGMQTIGDEITMAINARPHDTQDDQPIRVPSGIFVFDPDFGMYHKHSLGLRKDSSTETDVGYVSLYEIGALFPTKDEEAFDQIEEQSDFMVGYTLEQDDGVYRTAIAVQDKRGERRTAIKAGVIVTTQVQSEEVTETWKNIYLMTNEFEGTDDLMTVKYRSKVFVPKLVEVTWVNETSFTDANSSVWGPVLTDFDEDKGKIYEIETLDGAGAGMLSHIENITESGGTYTVTLDETHAGATAGYETNIRLDMWTKIGTMSYEDSLELFKSFNPEAVSTWIQFKIFMLGKGVELERFLAKSSVTQEI